MRYEWSETQVATAGRIARLPRENQARELLKWALARITHYGPMDEPCAVCIREFLNGQDVAPRGELEPIGSYVYPVSDKEHKTAPFFAKRPLPADVPNPNGWPLVQIMVRGPIGKLVWINVDERQIPPQTGPF